MRKNLDEKEAPAGYRAQKTLHKIEESFLSTITNKCNLCDYRKQCIQEGAKAFSCMSYLRKDETGVIFKKQ